VVPHVLLGGPGQIWAMNTIGNGAFDAGDTRKKAIAAGG
jgi:hypothetical protein